MAIKVVVSHAHEDKKFLDKLSSQLKTLENEGLIELLPDRNISAGAEWEREIDKRLNSAQIILLLVSPDFLNSDYAYSVEMRRAIERHKQEKAIVIPIILRYVYWERTPFSKLQALPKDAKPVVSPSWHDVDEAFTNVVEGIRTAAKKLSNEIIKLTAHEVEVRRVPISVDSAPRGSVCEWCGKLAEMQLTAIGGEYRNEGGYSVGTVRRNLFALWRRAVKTRTLT